MPDTGTTREVSYVPISSSADPTHAGLHLPHMPQEEGAAGTPRTRGATPAGQTCGIFSSEIPPRPRGYTQILGIIAKAREDSPAPAGLHPATWRTATTWRRFPRARGATPFVGFPKQLVRVIPPRPRGYTCCPDYGTPYTTALPAPAGLHQERTTRWTYSTDTPGRTS